MNLFVGTRASEIARFSDVFDLMTTLLKLLNKLLLVTDDAKLNDFFRNLGVSFLPQSIFFLATQPMHGASEKNFLVRD